MNPVRLLLTLTFLLLAAPVRAAGAADPLLEEAVNQWLGERDHWAFTQKAVEFDDGKRRERLERYDPSRPGKGRWTLLAIDGRAPTPEEQAAWEKRKFKRNPRRIDSPIGDFFDFHAARVDGEDAQVVRYEIPLRGDKQWLFESDKVRVIVTVNKQTRALEHLSATVREPVKVLLGLARITDGQLDLSFMQEKDDDSAAGPESARPVGSATVKVSKLGEKAEFTWSDFKRVAAAPRVSRGEGEGRETFTRSFR